MDNLTILFIWAGSVLIASTVHEYAHALVATKLGDVTPKINDRLSLNPLAHIDPIGALSLIIFRFGWSKPVPINPQAFDNPTMGTALTSLAGPAANIILIAVINTLNILIGIYSPELASIFEIIMYPLVLINASLAIFNLIPIAPLDGSKIVAAFLPTRLQYQWNELEKYGIYILLAFILPFSPFSPLFTRVMTAGIAFVLNIFP